MPRGRSPPSSKYVRKRPYYATSSSVKRPAPIGRQIRTMSRSPHRGRSPPRHRILASHHSGSPKHERSISNSRFSGRPFNRAPRSTIKRSRSPIHHRHSLSPPRKSSVRKPSPSPPRKSPLNSKRHSVSPSLRRKPADDRNGSPRRMDVACHRDARYFSPMLWMSSPIKYARFAAIDLLFSSWFMK